MKNPSKCKKTGWDLPSASMFLWCRSECLALHQKGDGLSLPRAVGCRKERLSFPYHFSWQDFLYFGDLVALAQMVVESLRWKSSHAS